MDELHHTAVDLARLRELILTNQSVKLDSIKGQPQQQRQEAASCRVGGQDILCIVTVPGTVPPIHSQTETKRAKHAPDLRRWLGCRTSPHPKLFILKIAPLHEQNKQFVRHDCIALDYRTPPQKFQSHFSIPCGPYPCIM